MDFTKLAARCEQDDKGVQHGCHMLVGDRADFWQVGARLE